VPLGKSLHAEPTPFVNSDGRDRTGPGSAGSVQAAYVRLVAIVLNEGDILWSVANGDALRNDPTFKALNLLALGTPGRWQRSSWAGCGPEVMEWTPPAYAHHRPGSNCLVKGEGKEGRRGADDDCRRHAKSARARDRFQ
jgi:hypothetical protein